MKKPKEYIIPYLPVHFDVGDQISVYVVHPDTLDKYSWEEVKQTKNYWFARIIIPSIYQATMFPLELNRVVKE